jgi:hypothetical protein
VTLTALALIAAAATGTAIAATSGHSAGQITAVKVVRGDGYTGVSSDWQDLPGASTTISIPQGQRGLIIARFTAESNCYWTAPRPITITQVGRCEVRVLIGDVEGAPASDDGHPPIFDTAEPVNLVSSATLPGDGPESHATERSRGGFTGLPSGSYSVRVQHRERDAGTGYQTETQLNHWHLTVERAQTG